MTITADKYYGEAARRYDAERCHSLRWAREQQAVADFVFSGPILDVPLGTGRYVGIYWDKGLDVIGVDVSVDMLAEAKKRYPELDARPGSVLSLPFADKTFGTVVCTRLLDWLPPADMERAVAELRRMANIIIVTIRHGREEARVNYTHDLNRFYRAIDGLHVEQRRVTEVTRDGTEEVFRLCLPTWADVLKPFSYPDAYFRNPADEIERIACDCATAFGQHRPVIRAETVKVRAEYWNAAQFASVINAMATVDPSYRTDVLPRFPGGAAVMLRTTAGAWVLDGRRRINQWLRDNDLHPVLVIDA